jgi:hypothetical protein
MTTRTAIKLLAAGAILAFLSAKVDLAEAARLIARADPCLLAAAVAASLAIIAADAAFWSRSMRIVGVKMAFRPALAFSIVGWFFANLAPSTVGADLFRAAQMRHAGAGVATSVRLVAAARLMSLASLIVVIAAGLPFAFQAIDGDAERKTVVAVFGIAALSFAAFVNFGPMVARFDVALPAARLRHVAALAADTRALVAKLTPGGWFYLSAQHLLRVAGVALIGAALGARIDAAALFALVPVALLIAMIPLTFGGWGVREASFVHFLGYAGVDAATALAVSVVYGLTRVLIGAAGGAAWAAMRRDQYEFAFDESVSRASAGSAAAPVPQERRE